MAKGVVVVSCLKSAIYMRLRTCEHRSWEIQYLSSTVARSRFEPTTLRSRVRLCDRSATTTDDYHLGENLI